nr:MAG TPA: Transcriptional repressor CTCF/DNA Complex-binding factor, CTCF, zinc finger [Caudoviricetes sp.]
MVISIKHLEIVLYLRALILLCSICTRHFSPLMQKSRHVTHSHPLDE